MVTSTKGRNIPAVCHLRSLAATTAQTRETCEGSHQAFPVLEPQVAFPWGKAKLEAWDSSPYPGLMRSLGKKK